MASDLISLFVYGTLKPGFAPYESLCGQYPHTVQPAIASGRLYHLPFGYPAMTLESGIVQGYCLTFRDAGILTVLDDYEQHDWQAVLRLCPDHPWGNDYERSRLSITEPAGSCLGEAWAYVMTIEKIQRLQGRWIPEGNW